MSILDFMLPCQQFLGSQISEGVIKDLSACLLQVMRIKGWDSFTLRLISAAVNWNPESDFKSPAVSGAVDRTVNTLFRQEI